MLATFLSRRNARREAASRLYAAVVAQARRPEFYARLGVADSLDGRFDMIALHTVLVARRLDREGRGGRRLGQAVFGVLFDDMDRSLREMGVGDLAVGKRVKAMAKALFGRAKAYGDALDAGGEGLADALERNLYRSAPPPAAAVEAMAAYAHAAAHGLDSQDGAALLSGEAAFPDPPAPPRD